MNEESNSTTFSVSSTLKPQRRMNGVERRQVILDVAIHILATRGLEGFRTHDVAQQAGITNATLLYYFPTKEALIEGVAAHLEWLYAQPKAPALKSRAGESSVLRALRQEFADAQFLRQHRPEMLAVSREFALRANRDPQIRSLVDRLTDQWRSHVEEILRSGKKDRTIRADVDPKAGAAAIVSALWGATALLAVSDADFDRLSKQLTGWIAVEK